MERTIQTKFYEFNQNNSGGRFDVDENVCHRVVIEALDAKHAITLFEPMIENQSSFTVKLLRRHWFITDSNLIKREVEGEGVVGQTPTLEPGQDYEYISACNLQTDTGKMYGFYIFERL